MYVIEDGLHVWCNATLLEEEARYVLTGDGLCLFWGEPEADEAGYPGQQFLFLFPRITESCSTVAACGKCD